MNEFQQKKVVGTNIFQLIIDLDLSKDLLELFLGFLTTGNNFKNSILKINNVWMKSGLSFSATTDQNCTVNYKSSTNTNEDANRGQFDASSVPKQRISAFNFFFKNIQGIILGVVVQALFLTFFLDFWINVRDCIVKFISEIFKCMILYV